MKHTFTVVLSLLLLLLLPSLAMAQSQIVRRPTTKPKTVQKKTAPKAKKVMPKKATKSKGMSEAESLEAERLEAERQKAAKQEAERLEAEQLKAAKQEAERLEAERQKAEKLKAERLEAERRSVLNNLVSNMVYVQGGTFTMGATAEQRSNAYNDEKPTHKVTVSSFSIGKYEVTQKEWKAVMGSNPSYSKGDNLPVENVSWDDCQEFIRKLNSLTGKNFRLPTEAEWEYAARGGNESQGYKYAGSNNLDKVGWYTDNSGSTTHEVGTKSPNELGLYDMSGNVREWCFDWYGAYSSNAQTNPMGPSSYSHRVFRGGAGYCRVSYRYYDAPGYRNSSLGLRLAL